MTCARCGDLLLEDRFWAWATDVLFETLWYQMRKHKVVYLRNVPPDLVNKLKAAAALSGGQSIQRYVSQLLLDHVAELECKGELPKGPR